MMCIRVFCKSVVLTLVGLLVLTAAVPSQAQDELSYAQYRQLSWAADRLGHLAQFEPIHGEPGMFFAIGERLGTVQVIKMDGRGSQNVWKSNQLDGIPEEVLTADMDGDSLDDAIVCRTSTGKLYIWSMDGYGLLWESLPNEYATITCFTMANIDDDQATEIVMVADNHIVYIDGGNYSRQFRSLNEYQATQVRCGDVDGDNRIEIVLNTGQVVDSASGDVEWEDETFFARIELLDIDGDGIPEVLTENPGGGPLKIFNVGYRSEVRLQ